MNVTVSDFQPLYVLDHGTGYTCLGFDVAIRRATAYAQWAGVDSPNPELRGTMEGYADYQRCLDAALEKVTETGQRCPAELHPQLIGLERRRVEVTEADGRTYRFQVGKSAGHIPVHLQIARRNCYGGPPVDSRPFQSVRVIR